MIRLPSLTQAFIECSLEKLNPNLLQLEVFLFQSLKSRYIENSCLFVRPARELFHSNRDVNAANLDLCWTLIAIEQGVFFACHTYCGRGGPVNGHLRGPVTLTPIAERLAVELSLPVFTT